MAFAFATPPPNPIRHHACLPPTTPPSTTDLASLIKLHEMGIIDKKELRERVLSYRPPVQPAPVQPAPVSRIVPSTPAQSPTVCGKRKREQIEKKVQPAQQRFNKKEIKKTLRTFSDLTISVSQRRRGYNIEACFKY